MYDIIKTKFVAASAQQRVERQGCFYVSDVHQHCVRVDMLPWTNLYFFRIFGREAHCAGSHAGSKPRFTTTTKCRAFEAVANRQSNVKKLGGFPGDCEKPKLILSLLIILTSSSLLSF